MEKIGEEYIMKLLRSGNFTLITWDNGEYTLYEGVYDIDEIDDDTPEVDFVDFYAGYMPKIVELMAKALGGKADSI
jgi:hypothetical protein